MISIATWHGVQKKGYEIARELMPFVMMIGDQASATWCYYLGALLTFGCHASQKVLVSMNAYEGLFLNSSFVLQTRKIVLLSTDYNMW